MLATRALESVFAFPNHGSNIHVSIHDLLNHEQSDGSFSHAQAYPYARYHAKSAIDERHSSRADERRDTEQAITIVKSWLTGQFSYGQELNTAIGLILTDSAIVLDLVCFLLHTSVILYMHFLSLLSACTFGSRTFDPIVRILLKRPRPD